MGLVDGWGIKQLRWVMVGAAASTVVLLVPYKTAVNRAYLVYGLNLLLLVAVLFTGERKGSSRWIHIGGFGFQPSELMKLTLILTLARFIRFRSSYKTFAGLGAPFLLTIVPMALILKQPDLGTALICVPLLFVTLFVAGARPRHLALITLLGALSIYPVYKFGLEDYQQDRIHGFLAQLPLVPQTKVMDKKEERALGRGNNYQVEQSKIAVGTGGWLGMVQEEGDPSALAHLPERHNDFIFPVIANRWGLIGCVLLLGTYLWLLIAILAVAVRQRDPAGRLICVGVFTVLGFQGFVNITMTLGLMPITGMTLPFVSYGGTSLIVSMLAVAMVCNVAARPSFEFGRGDFD
ncbi:MAG: FtsW/RodA/SpoVE family cell cycle protein [Planctomycetota bacterium]